MFTDVFNDLLDESGLNRRQFAEKSGIPYTTVVGWTTLKRLPDFTALVRIADFFECSLDYLTERNGEYGNTVSNELTSEERKLLAAYRALDIEDKKTVTRIVVALDRHKD